MYFMCMFILRHEVVHNLIIKNKKDEIVDTTYGEKNMRPSSGSTNERNTVKGEKTTQQAHQVK